MTLSKPNSKFNQNKFERTRSKPVLGNNTDLVVAEETEVVIFKSRVDYFKYTDNPEEVKRLKELEEVIFYTSGKMEELRTKRWEALTEMRAILKKDGTFTEVARQIGMSKDIIYDTNLREKIYTRYDIGRKDVLSLPTRAVRAISKYEFTDSELKRILNNNENLQPILVQKEAEKQKVSQKEQERQDRIKKLLTRRKRLVEEIAEIDRELEQLNYVESSL